MNEYKEDLRIDVHALDVEWLQQPERFMKYAKLYEDAKREVDRLKEQLDLATNDGARKVRRKPKKFKVIKGTDKEIMEIVTSLKSVQAASAALADAKYEAGVLSAAVRAFDQRKKALEHLVTLHGQRYFAGPRAPRTEQDIADGIERRAAHSTMPRRKRKKTA